MTPAITEHTNCLIRGVVHVGRERLQQAEAAGIAVIDEMGLFALISQSATPAVPPAAPAPAPSTRRPFAWSPKPKVAVVAKVAPVSRASTGIRFDPPRPPPSRLLTERFRPTEPEHLMGNEAAIGELRHFLRDAWDRPRLGLVAVLTGPPGVGKSSAAAVLARKQGFHVVEYNASDTRSQQQLDAEGFVFRQRGGLYGRTVLVFDEVDGMGGGDKGGQAALQQLAQKSEAPVIVIANDERKIEGLTKIAHAVRIVFGPLQMREMAERLDEVCRSEGIEITADWFRTLLTRSRGDLRQVLNAIDFWRADATQSFGTDAEVTDPITALGQVWRPQGGLERRVEAYFVDPQAMPGLVYVTLDTGTPIDQWVEALDSVADGDLMGGGWGAMPAHAVVSCVIPAVRAPRRAGMALPKPWALWKEYARLCRTRDRGALTRTAMGFVDRVECGPLGAELLMRRLDALEQGNREQFEAALQELDVGEAQLGELCESVALPNQPWLASFGEKKRNVRAPPPPDAARGGRPTRRRAARAR